MKPPPVRDAVYDLTKPRLRAFAALHDLLKIPAHQRDASYWESLLQWRDEALAALRGPLDMQVLRIMIGQPAPRWLSTDPEWRAEVWAGALQKLEAWSEELDRAYFRYVTEQARGLSGTA
jgi:hypothetical protein